MARQESFPAKALATFPRTLGACNFAFDSLQNPVIEAYTKEIEVLKEKVKSMLVASLKDLVINIELINLLCRLGISYHFQNEIEKQLSHIFDAVIHTQLQNMDDYNLHIVALVFRILRQFGYTISCDVFKKFKGRDGKFNKDINNDVRGILSLYEATFLKMHGEEILDEALAFARPRLQVLAKESNPNLAEHINKALRMPFHRGLPRLEAREYISFYEQEESHSDTLLKFAKLDFNRLQLLHRQELSFLSGWWAELNIAKSFPYARDVIVDAYVAGYVVHHEPEFSLSRIILAKTAQLLVLLDDTFDSHGTREELESLTAAFERCSFDAIDELCSDDMKILYKTFLDYLAELEYHANKDGRCYSFHHAKDKLKELVRSYLVEVRWHWDKKLPSFTAYMKTASITCLYNMATAVDFLTQKIALFKEIEWLQSNPKLVEASSVLCRLIDDMFACKHEEKEGYCLAWKCYMKDYGVSKEKAMVELGKMCDNAWEDMNEEILRLKDSVPMPLLTTSVNLARLMEVIYRQYGQRLANISNSKVLVELLLLQQIPL